MYILTQSEQLEKSKNEIYLVEAPEIEKEYLTAGYKRYERTYKMTCHHKDYSVVCTVFRDNKKGSEPVVIIPEFHIPGRPYPVYIYILFRPRNSMYYSDFTCTPTFSRARPGTPDKSSIPGIAAT